MDAAFEIQNVKSSAGEWNRKLMTLGIRRYGDFICHHAPEAQDSTMLGLWSPPVLFPLLRDESARIKVLRDVAANLPIPEDELIIRYKHTSLAQRRLGMDKKRKYNKRLKLVDEEELCVEYASALPVLDQPAKKSAKRQRLAKPRHKRWIIKPWPGRTFYRARIRDSCVCEKETGCGHDCLCLADVGGCTQTCACNNNVGNCVTTKRLSAFDEAAKVQQFAIDQEMDEDCNLAGAEAIAKHCLEANSTDTEKTFQELLDDATDTAKDLFEATWLCSSLRDSEEIYIPDAPWVRKCSTAVRLRLVAGDPSTAALYQRVNANDEPDSEVSGICVDEFGFEDLEAILGHDLLSIPKLYDYLRTLSRKVPWKHFYRSVRALAAVSEVYKLLPEATISLNVASRPLTSADWVDSTSPSEPGYNPWVSPMTLPRTF